MNNIFAGILLALCFLVIFTLAAVIHFSLDADHWDSAKAGEWISFIHGMSVFLLILFSVLLVVIGTSFAVSNLPPNNAFVVFIKGLQVTG